MKCNGSIKAVGYVRVSSDEQADSGLSLEHQETRIRHYSASAGLELVGIIRDEAVSGGKSLASRKGGAALLAMLADGSACHVVALKLDRLFRDAADALNQTAAWDKEGVGLHLIDMGGQSINTRSAMGKMFFTVAAGFAEMERGLIRERTAAALRVKKARGEVVSRPTIGFDAVDGKLVPNAAEQALIERMIAMKSEGKSLHQIADALNAEGVATKRGGTWHASTVRNVLTRSPAA
jgi:site-specific DNA recombinase